MNTEKYPDQKLVEQLAAQFASQNPCCTSDDIMEMVSEEISKRMKQKCIPENTDA